VEAEPYVDLWDNPAGAPDGIYRTIHGGYYGNIMQTLSVSARGGEPPANMKYYLGIRCAQ